MPFKTLKPIPINQTAANVMKAGEHWSPSCRMNTVESDIPFPVVPESMIGRGELFTLPNLTGIQRGRLVVFGFCWEARRWSCRCKCGKWVLRRTRAMDNEENAADACTECRELMYLKREEHWRRYGKRITYEELV